MKVRAAIATMTMVIISLFAAGAPAQAEESSCYGASCIGMNPEGTTCAKDAYSVLAMDVQGDGMLELRYSPSCKANWGRYSSYWLQDIVNSWAGTGISYADLYVWNPDEPLYGVVQGSQWWTSMVDGTITACTGVELVAQDTSPGGYYSEPDPQGWVGNLCG